MKTIITTILCYGLCCATIGTAPSGLRPTLSIEVDRKTGDVLLTVVSGVAWRLETSGLLDRGWFEIRRGTPVPGEIHFVQVLDKGWARVAIQSFYRVVENKPLTR